MLNKNLIVLSAATALAVLSVFFFQTGYLFAQEEQTTNTEISEVVADEDITASDLGVGEPRILPDSPFYFVKNISRSLRSALTFDPVKKAELKLRFANEKLIEAKKLTEKKKNPKVVEKVLKDYQKDLEGIRSLTEKIRTKSNTPAVDRFMEKLVDATLKHQVLFDRFDKEVPLDFADSIEKAKEKNLEEFSNVATRVLSPENLKEKLEKKIREGKGSDFRYFKHLEVLKGVKEMVPENAKGVIEEVIERNKEQLEQKLKTLPLEKKERFVEYIKTIGGDPIKHLEILDELEKGEMPQEIREKMMEAKQRIIEKAGERFKALPPTLKQRILKKLERGGAIEKLRVIDELQENLSPESVQQILEAKKRIRERLVEKLQEAETREEKLEILKEFAERFYDAKQLKILQELEPLLSPEEKQLLEEVRERVKEKIQEELKRTQNLSLQKRRMIFEKISGDSPEELEILKKTFPGINQEVIESSAENIMRKLSYLKNPERLEALKNKLEEKEDVKEMLRTVKPDFFEKIREYRKNIEQKISPETVKERIEKAKDVLRGLKEEVDKLDADTQDYLRKNSSYFSLIKRVQEHILAAESALEQGKTQEAFGQSVSALNIAVKAKEIVERAKERRSVEEKRRERIKSRIEEIKRKYPDAVKESIQDLLPQNVLECPLLNVFPDREGCPGGKWVIKKDWRGCPKYVCLREKGEEGVEKEIRGNKGFEQEKKGLQKQNMIDGEGIKEREQVCVQVITPALSPEGICKEFPTPCDVPLGWRKVDKCENQEEEVKEMEKNREEAKDGLEKGAKEDIKSKLKRLRESFGQ